jgi:hypothetical protein
MARGTSDQFDQLHSLLIESLVIQLNAWKEGRLVDLGKEGEYVKVCPPALLAQAIKLLKDNGVDQPAQKGNRVDTLKGAMPDFDDLQDNIIPMRRS